MSKDTPNKQKNIDDVLLSIDSLLDTATDIQLGHPDTSPAEPTSNKTKDSGKQAGVAKAIKPQKPKPKPKASPKSELSEKTIQKKPGSEAKAASADNQPANPGKPVAAQNKARREILKQTTKVHETAPQNQTDNSQKPVNIEQPAATKTNIAVKNEDSATTKKPAKKEPVRNINMDEEPSGSLNFTTVNDDLSQAMRELPILEDIVTAEDLALIGSGKEPPKKILTEAFKRLSLTDKLIEILENQLSDYNISKLEYKYLHELFDELIDKENDKK